MATDDTGPDDRAIRIVSIIVADEKPVMGTQELADRFDISQQAMIRHLNRLHDEGVLHTEKIGRVKVWWPTEKGLGYLDPA